MMHEGTVLHYIYTHIYGMGGENLKHKTDRRITPLLVIPTRRGVQRAWQDVRTLKLHRMIRRGWEGTDGGLLEARKERGRWRACATCKPPEVAEM